MKWLSASVIVINVLAGPAASLAFAQPASAQLATELVPPSSPTRLEVSSPAFQAGQAIPEPYGQEGERFSPALTWKGAPSGTRSFVVILEDPDAKEPRPFVHWTLYNLPATTTRLAESIPALPQLPDLEKARQGRNSRGTVGYTGPRPPLGDPPHHYHFQVFALDAPLTVTPGADRAALLTAMKAHVLASGEVVGTFQRR